MKRSFKKEDYINILILCLMYLFIVVLITHGKFMYGSKIDWDVQHWAFPEYFRNLFYDSKSLIPSFAPNIGGGQNIFYFAYYGLLNPIVLISYLFPKINMASYILVTSMIIIIVSVILFYKWLKNKNYNSMICFCASSLFLCAGPLIFQSHRHIMFINYMPFLILALMSVDKYFEKNIKTPLIISVFLIIMTSYFFSVGSILCITIYGIYTFLNKYDKVNFKLFLKEGIKFLSIIITGILMAAVLLFPTAYCLLNGRAHGGFGIGLSKLLMPHFGLEYLLYTSYSVGLTAISVIALFCLITKKNKSVLFLTLSLVSIMSLNVIVYFLNGSLYLSGKALIPLLPLYTLIVTMFLNKVIKKEIELKDILLIFSSTVLVALALSKLWITILYLLDGLVMIFLINNYFKKGNKNRLLILIIIINLLICIGNNFSDKLVSKEKYLKMNNPDIKELVDEASKDKDFYRMHIDVNNVNVNRILNKKQNSITLYSSTYNKNYNKFFYKVFNNNMMFRNSAITHENKNVLFENFMGVKYLITDKRPPLGYEKILSKNKYTLYINNNSLPIGYATSNIISYKDYKDLQYPYNLEALMNNIIVKDAPHKKLNTNIKKNIVKNISNIKNITISGKDFYVANNNGKLRLNLNEEIKNKILLIRLTVSKPQSCSTGDTSITINGIKNKLTCKEWKYFNKNYTFDYTISQTETFDFVDLSFTKGHYRINDIEIYTLDYKDIVSLNNNIDKFNITKTLKDDIYGNINVSKNGYFMFTIPYDEGFKIKDNNKEVNYEKTNDGFIGFKIKKGKHNIKLTYQAPYLKEGKIVSVIGFIICTQFFIVDLIAIKKKKRLS